MNKQVLEAKQREHFAKSALCLGYLYVNNLITKGERDAITRRLSRYRDKYNVVVTEAQINSVRLTYNDIATDEEGGEEEE